MGHVAELGGDKAWAERIGTADDYLAAKRTGRGRAPSERPSAHGCGSAIWEFEQTLTQQGCGRPAPACSGDAHGNPGRFRPADRPGTPDRYCFDLH